MIKCPKCGHTEVECESKTEYTGGGYAEYWDEFFCKQCNHEWRSEKRSDYF